ncbi:Protein transport protein ssh1 [Polyplax serrata]|uniref:Protein transport protein ssh1 n=1 Tax=Polyplax serrata TaxID=468196 RepID=A0AAN8NQ17_POLSC
MFPFTIGGENVSTSVGWAVKLESVHPGRTRYLVVVSCIGRQDAEECCLLGIDCNERTTVGLVLRVLADTTITLDGDGGFSVCVCGRQHIFKPVSVQAMW